jgi:hypothetical protein
MSAINNSLNNDINNKVNDNDKLNNLNLSPKLALAKSPQKSSDMCYNNIRLNNDSFNIKVSTKNRKSPRSYSNDSHSSINSSKSSSSNTKKLNDNRSESTSLSPKSNSIKKSKSPNPQSHQHQSKLGRSSEHYQYKESKHSCDNLSLLSKKYHYNSDNQHFPENKNSAFHSRNSRSLEKYTEFNSYYNNTNYQRSNEDDERERYAGEYTSICLKNLNEKINIDELKQAIYDLFSNYRKFSVKVVNNKKTSTSIERIAFVNFSNHVDAKSAKRSKMNKSFYGYQLYIEPVFHSYSNRKSQSPSPLHYHQRDADRNDFNSSPSTNKHINPHTRSPPPKHHYQSYSNYFNNQFNNKNSILRQRSRSQSPPHQRLHPKKNFSSHSITNSTSPTTRNSRSVTPSRNLNRLKNSPLSPKDKYYYKKSNFKSRTPSPIIIRPLTASPRNKRHRSRSKSIDKNLSSSINSKQKIYNMSPKREIISSSTYHYYHVRTKEPTYSSSTCNNLRYSYSSRSPSPPPSKYLKKHRSRSRSKKNSPIPHHYYSSSSSSSKLLNQHYNENNRGENRHYDNNDLSYKLNIKSSKHYFHHHYNSPSSPSPPPLPSHHNHHTTEYDRHHQYDYKSQQQLHYNLNQGGVTHYFDNDDKDATRTLFIGNLDNDIDRLYLERIFERYGCIEEIEIKRNQSVQPPYMYHHGSSSSSSNSTVKKTYAFIKYELMDMAISAKKHLNNKLIGKNEIKIGFGNYIIKLIIYIYIYLNINFNSVHL